MLRDEETSQSPELVEASLCRRWVLTVIPAPIAYLNVVAVKKLVVETWAWLAGPPHRVHSSGRAFLLKNLMPFTGRAGESGLLL